MGSKQIRIGQLISPFGPGSIYTDRRGVPHVVAGLDHWYLRWDQVLGKMVPCTKPEEFELFEPRLSTLLRVDRFRFPPDHRHVKRGQAAPPNASLYVPALRFPRWYRQTNTGKLHRFNLDSARIANPAGGGRWQPVRFISVCDAGHLCEFPWKRWIDCQCDGDGDLVLTDRGGSELSSIRVECKSCPPGSLGNRGRSLARTTIIPDADNGEQSTFQRAGIDCPGDRPWLGEDAAETGCNRPLVGALINQTNLYFPRTISAIALPEVHLEDDSVRQLRVEIERDPGSLGVSRTLWNMGNRNGTVALIKDGLKRRNIDADDSQVEIALQSLFDPKAAKSDNALPPIDPESELLEFRRDEFNVLRDEVNDPKHVPHLRVIPSRVPHELTSWIARVNLVERLRETRAFYGFDRLQPKNEAPAAAANNAMRQLFRSAPKHAQDRWLPAVDVFGEGIYLELREDRLLQWQSDQASSLQRRLDDGFIMRLAGIFQTLPPIAAANRSWASRYLVVHSLAHILINQFVFECGYSTASLRERLYVSADPVAPMAGVLIYTAAGDSEGTLGGLIQLGRPDRLGPVMQRALSRASWCSADPVCSEHLGGQGSRLANLAACHACALLPETSCETINQGLDRATIVGTPDERTLGLMSELLDESEKYALA